MQVHGPDTTVRSVDAGEYHLGAVAIYLGPYRVVTYSEADCDMIIAAACKAKQMHAAATGRPVPARVADLGAVRARLESIALGDEDPPDWARKAVDDAESGRIAMEGTL